jgi:hypothetical protein
MQVMLATIRSRTFLSSQLLSKNLKIRICKTINMIGVHPACVLKMLVIL